MKITRIYTDESGESHFDEYEENGVETRNNAEYTRAIDAYGLVFKERKPLGDEPVLGGWPTAPQRIVRAGDVLLVEDTTGKGHRNRRLSPDPEFWAFVRSR